MLRGRERELLDEKSEEHIANIYIATIYIHNML